MAIGSDAIVAIARELADHITDDAKLDLAFESTPDAIELHFPPVRVRALDPGVLTGDVCSTDGFYTDIVPDQPWILYANDTAPARVRFTLLHELGHHLLATSAAHLRDAIDDAARSGADTQQIEEAVCHRLAGELLIPTPTIEETIRAGPPTPRHVIAIRERTNASWEAISVRVADYLHTPGAVILTRTPGVISFCAGHRLEAPWWPRGSPSDPAGPIARAFGARQVAIREIYRHRLSYARQLVCDTEQVHDRLAISILGEKASDGRFTILEDPEPSWKSEVLLCEHCGDERTVGWCERCRGRRCSSCDRCGCSRPRSAHDQVCPKCWCVGPFRPGAAVCRDCEG